MTTTSPPGRFEPELETEYVRKRLLNNRTLIRMTCLLGLAVAGLRVGEIFVSGTGLKSALSGPMLAFPVIVLTTSVLLTWFAWTPWFANRYLPLANFAVPLRNVFAAIGVGMVAARGQTELLMVMTAMVLSPFFFLGLHFRPALVCVALTIIAYTIAALAAGMAAHVLLRSSGFLLVTAAMSAVAAWQMERQSRQSFLEGRLIAQLAEHDALTGAKNRRVFDEHLARLWQQALDDRRRLAILLVDVDHFKAYNDRYGHQAGDVTLKRVARAALGQVHRPLDLLARYGGEEFAALLYDVDERQAREIAERMRLAVSSIAIEHRDSRAARVVTISIGVAAVQPSYGRTPLGALQLADEALYVAKVAGRNRVHLAAEADYLDLETGIFAQRAVGG